MAGSHIPYTTPSAHSGTSSLATSIDTSTPVDKATCSAYKGASTAIHKGAVITSHKLFRKVTQLACLQANRRFTLL